VTRQRRRFDVITPWPSRQITLHGLSALRRLEEYTLSDVYDDTWPCRWKLIITFIWRITISEPFVCNILLIESFSDGSIKIISTIGPCNHPKITTSTMTYSGWTNLHNGVQGSRISSRPKCSPSNNKLRKSVVLTRRIVLCNCFLFVSAIYLRLTQFSVLRSWWNMSS
jgi:hypothetical protein